MISIKGYSREQKLRIAAAVAIKRSRKDVDEIFANDKTRRLAAYSRMRLFLASHVASDHPVSGLSLDEARIAIHTPMFALIPAWYWTRWIALSEARKLELLNEALVFVRQYFPDWAPPIALKIAELEKRIGPLQDFLMCAGRL